MVIHTAKSASPGSMRFVSDRRADRQCTGVFSRSHSTTTGRQGHCSPVALRRTVSNCWVASFTVGSHVLCNIASSCTGWRGDDCGRVGMGIAQARGRKRHGRTVSCKNVLHDAFYALTLPLTLVLVRFRLPSLWAQISRTISEQAWFRFSQLQSAA